MVKIVSWNIARRDDAWRRLRECDSDIALLQEAAPPPADIAPEFDIDPAPWRTDGAGLNRAWRTAIVRLSDRVSVQYLDTKPIADAHRGDLAVSRPGTLTAAIVTPATGDPLVVASMYAPWEAPHHTAGSGWIYADASAHRVISDISVLIGRQGGYRILAAGDLNILHGHGEHGSDYWAGRYATVFSRMAALGLSFIGPQTPNGRAADPWPKELPLTSRNVPTYHATNQSPATATRQLDFVFASPGLARNAHVSAQNAPEHWGPSDHCRVQIEVT
jgi:endonuclease/exonuclease/phosphatase family metal-dependent hydrolase